jgi:hypothetical protein
MGFAPFHDPECAVEHDRLSWWQNQLAGAGVAGRRQLELLRTWTGVGHDPNEDALSLDSESREPELLWSQSVLDSVLIPADSADFVAAWSRWKPIHEKDGSMQEGSRNSPTIHGARVNMDRSILIRPDSTTGEGDSER